MKQVMVRVEGQAGVVVDRKHSYAPSKCFECFFVVVMEHTATMWVHIHTFV